MLTYASMLLAGTMVVGQAEKEKADQPEYNPHLKPVAWLIGDWEMKETSPIGEVKKIRHETWKWAADKSVLLGALTQKNADGSPDMAGFIIYYWDPEKQTIKCQGHFSGSFGTIIEDHTLVSTNGNEQLWDCRFVFPGGNQGTYHFKLTRDGDTYAIGWSKISGAGPQEMGPFVHKRKK